MFSCGKLTSSLLQSWKPRLIWIFLFSINVLYWFRRKPNNDNKIIKLRIRMVSSVLMYLGMIIYWWIIIDLALLLMLPMSSRILRSCPVITWTYRISSSGAGLTNLQSQNPQRSLLCLRFCSIRSIKPAPKSERNNVQLNYLTTPNWKMLDPINK